MIDEGGDKSKSGVIIVGVVMMNCRDMVDNVVDDVVDPVKDAIRNFVVVVILVVDEGSDVDVEVI